MDTLYIVYKDIEQKLQREVYKPDYKQRDCVICH